MLIAHNNLDNLMRAETLINWMVVTDALINCYRSHIICHHNHSVCLILITIVMVLHERELTLVICYRTKNKEANIKRKFSLFYKFFILHIKNSLVKTS